MAEIHFQPRYAVSSVVNPELNWLRELILDPFREGREFGEATIQFREGERQLRMILISDPKLGYYLNYDPEKDTWLSLGDASRLSEVICPDDWEASAGLFISADKAWLAISEFCQTGERSGAIKWIRPSSLPEDGNW
jgi:hypothetical protein